jgi:peptide/nickel transport system permease protein
VDTGLRRRLFRSPLSVGGLVIVTVLLGASLFPSLLTSVDPLAIAPAKRLQPPGPAHWAGTDELGRDLFARVVHGAALSLRAGVTVVALAMALGIVLGGIAGYGPRVVQEAIMRASDLFLSFPALMMAMAIVAALGPGLEHAVMAIAVVWWPQYARLMNAQVLTHRTLPYVEAARATGCSAARVLFRHILPNCMAPLVVKGTLDVGYAILLTASLSFLGLGAQPPVPEWGALITAGRRYLLDYWWYATVPGLAISLAVLGFNLLGDALGDLLDPRFETSV